MDRRWTKVVKDQPYNGTLTYSLGGFVGIEAIVVRVHSTGHASQTAATMVGIADKVKVTANGTIIETTSARLRALTAYLLGRTPSYKTSTGTTTQTYVDVVVPLGHAPGMGLRAADMAAQISLTFNATNITYFTDAAVFDISVLENRDLKSNAMFNSFIEETSDGAATGDSKADIAALAGGYCVGALLVGSVMGANQLSDVEWKQGSSVMAEGAVLAVMEQNRERLVFADAGGELLTSGEVTTFAAYIANGTMYPLDKPQKFRWARAAASTSIWISHRVLPNGVQAGANASILPVPTPGAT